MSLLFAVTLFVSAALLFWVQPLIAKMLLPLLGGTPAVWNTCMLFFQGMLLAGYAYALALTRWLKAGRQAALHLSLLVVAAVSLPFGLSESAGDVPAGGEPLWWLLKTLLVSVGLPFFALSATAPLLQKWFSKTLHRRARDPYYLYAASNAGSLLALVAFPVLFEPTLRLAEQGRVWALVYAALIALIAACALALRRSGATRETTHDETRGRLNGAKGAARDADEAHDEDGGARDEDRSLDETLTNARRLRWALLAFVPSCLVLGLTTYITTDVAAVPLLWVIPLALYLVTFVFAFAQREVISTRWMDRLLPGAGIVLTLVYLSGATEPAWFLILIHLIFFLIAAFYCHKQLAADRPPARHLAEFYLVVAAGGALGGVFNAIVAPLLFDSVVEYPLAVVLACLMRVPFGVGKRETAVGRTEAGRVETGDGRVVEGARVEALDESEVIKSRRARMLDFALPVAVGVLVASLSVVVMRLEMGSVERLALALGVPLALVNHLFTKRPLRFALALGAVMLGSIFFTENGARLLHAERNFYGTLRVTEDPSNRTRRLHHGSTIHGRQFADASRACEPLSYYHRQGPLGSVFKAFDAEGDAAQHVAAVGLGTGASAAYSLPGQTWTFYEINPAVVRLARDAGPFTYLRDCARAPVEVVLGDARLQLRHAPESHYGLILLDAFSSDAIPAHLLTREALDLYLSKLAEGGWLALHVSNRALDLHAVVSGLARDANLPALVFDDMTYDRESAREPSQWIVVARRAEDLTALSADARWRPLHAQGRRTELWRDDFSNIITVFKWKG